MRKTIWALLGLGVLPSALATDTLSTQGFSLCETDTAIKVQDLDITYTRSTRELVFDLAGTNSKEQNVTATLTVNAYGHQIYTKTFDPCGSEIHVAKLCPVPSGHFEAQGTITVPESYASQIPSIAFNIPDLDGQAKLVLTSDGEDTACVESSLSNGKSTSIKGVAWASAGIAAGALALSGLSALGTAGGAGVPSTSPSAGDVVGWFGSIATNGMLSVSHPTIYKSFTKNFAWSTGLIPWSSMQDSIDSFRKATGGNLTQNSYVYLSGLSSVQTSNGTSSKRSLDLMYRTAGLMIRSESSSNSTSSSSTDCGSLSISSFKCYSEELMIPSANIFMTILLVFAIVVAVVVVGILLVKVILEIWALYGNFPNKLIDFRKDYWGIMARTITNMILVLYGIWVMYCVYQLREGDSWAAKVLAAVTLAVFTAILAFFAWRIFYMARKYKQAEGDTTGLFDDKDTWRKYSLFYDNFKKDFWWIFVPVIIYGLAKGIIIAGAEGNGMAQTIGQLIVEALLLTLLLWNRPYATKSSMGIHMTIQVVRVLSVVCVLVFVEELGLSQTTKTVTGIVLIVVQSSLSGVLAILIAVNAIIVCIRENPHSKKRREAEKANQDLDDLTPLDARESLLIDHPAKRDFTEMSKFNFTGPYEPYRDNPKHHRGSTESKDNLVYSDYGVAHDRNHSPEPRPDSRHSGRRSPSLEGRHPTTAGFGMAY
ncbi:hypothetical protein N7462_009852 [Penicillium macrosclerotiorum]|uniref:uncharacterized protein n=1 Tax=Penicillium macrosclerotiorum TaxID=303699 RepID=UPI002548F657|nr:uncharacterized protein N7462_009852 [Penicillium macrosclerotiorum]KAJ5668782.1 hypothetical protein N7462_009852 [Penicillium macrosclerotiorum]